MQVAKKVKQLIGQTVNGIWKSCGKEGWKRQWHLTQSCSHSEQKKTKNGAYCYVRAAVHFLNDKKHNATGSIEIYFEKTAINLFNVVAQALI